jgi:hypothetical protein
MPRTFTDDWERQLEQDGLRRLLASLPFRRQVPVFVVYTASAAMILLIAALTVDATRQGESQPARTAFEAGLARDHTGNRTGN